jgi:RNA polymerase sigma factor (sigma-70 family)
MQVSRSVREMANSIEFQTAMNQIMKKFEYLEDFISEAIVKAIENDKFMDDMDKFLKYIVWKAFRLRIDSYRRKKFESTNPEAIEYASSSEGIAMQMIRKEEVARIKSVIQSLSYEDLELLTYRYEDEISFREMSEKIYHKAGSKTESDKLIKRCQNRLDQVHRKIRSRYSA